MSFYPLPTDRPTSIYSVDPPSPSLNEREPNIIRRDLVVNLACPDCQDQYPNITKDFKSGNLICGSCGIVFGDRISFADDDGPDPSRTGIASDMTLEPTRDLHTTIGFTDDHTGSSCHLRAIQARSNNGKLVQRLQLVFLDTEDSCNRMSPAQHIFSMVKQLYKRTVEKNVIPSAGSSRLHKPTIAACIVTARHDIHRQLQVSKKEFVACFRTIENAFGLKKQLGDTARTSSTGASAEDILPRCYNHLDLDRSFETMCHHTISNARTLGMTDGISPLSVTGGAIVFTTRLLGINCKIVDIERVVGCRASTIQKMYRKLVEQRELLVPPQWIESGKLCLDPTATLIKKKALVSMKGRQLTIYPDKHVFTFAPGR
ncbi:hypothetical protein DL93DRAFT_2148676 [Clavulina sp. PMI_390]|nr:hypothetical protein DL93DRAFT_2148676 [Clavulina sp. PMI_390]